MSNPEPLTAYQVGEDDVVAHFTPEGAIAFLCTYAGYPEGEFTTDDVEPVEDKLLDLPMRDEDGAEYPSLRTTLASLAEPAYLHSWQ
ncbi:hypothetical protein VQ574_20770 (plasmid) [Stutzerimonas frequens]|uniref:hypothetical protein n=1 Tax=Stutzerimonas frequens TaxID=2968969 RepID=UPI002DBEDD0B|nr:hypothetical protein [Stutzerimonas frequens]WRW29373.1 hypothetical protein VQ574_20770 [Stutzerimonas frequens]